MPRTALQESYIPQQQDLCFTGRPALWDDVGARNFRAVLVDEVRHVLVEQVGILGWVVNQRLLDLALYVKVHV